MFIYHTSCVGIKDLDSVEAWVCADCKASPKTVKALKARVETLIQTTAKRFKTAEALSEKMGNKFDNLNGRLTFLSNQNKNSNHSCTSSLSDIHQDMIKFRSEIDKNPIPFCQRARLLLIT